MPFNIDYFISRRGTHAPVAQEVAGILREIGVTSFSQDYDIAHGENFIGRIHDALGRCEHFIALLTSDYASAAYTKAEWTNFYPVYVETDGARRFIVIRLEDCEPPGLLRGIVYADLTAITDPQERRRRIVEAIAGRSMAIPRYDWLFENVPNRDLNFTGRDERLVELHRLLSAGDTPAAITQATQAAIHGLGGIGKTTLAAEYAHRYAAAYGGVWWVRAESRAVLIASLATLAGRLDPALRKEPDQEKGARDGLTVISHRAGLPLLLIYDNIESPETLRDLVPSSGARLLITTRYPDWSTVAAEVKLDVLTPTAATEFLQKRAGRSDPVEAGKLARTLGHLPLALDHAGAYCKLRGTSFKDYGKQVDERISFAPKGAPYPDSVAATFGLAIEKASSDHRQAETLLGLFAFLAPESIPLDLIDDSTMSEGDRTEALGALVEVSLAEHATLDDGAPAVTLHRLVQAATRRRLAESGQTAATIDRVATALFSAFPDSAYNNSDTWPKCAVFLPHVLALRTHWSQNSKTAAQLLVRVGNYLTGRGAYAEAKPVLREALSAAESMHGRDTSDITVYLISLANLLRTMNELDEAETLIREALVLDERTFGRNHIEVATDLANLAQVLDQTGRRNEATDISRELVTIVGNTVGKNHPHYARALNNLASVLPGTSIDEAEALYREALAISERVIGAGQLTTAIQLVNLARLLFATNRHEESLSCTTRAIAILERSIGPEHQFFQTTTELHADLLSALAAPTAQPRVNQARSRRRKPVNRRKRTPEDSP